MNYFIRRMVDRAIETVVQRYNAPTTEPKGNNISTKVMTPEEKLIVDAANGLYGIAGKVAVYIARSKHPREIGIYMPESDVIAQTAPYLAETRRGEAENNPTRISAVKNQKSGDSSQGRYGPRYRRTYGPRSQSGGKISKVYSTAELFGKLRPVQEKYDTNRTKSPPAQIVDINTYKSRPNQNPNILSQKLNSQETLDDRVRCHVINQAA